MEFINRMRPHPPKGTERYYPYFHVSNSANMKKSVYLFPVIFLMMYCSSSSYFRTPLNYLTDQWKVFPENITGTYFFMNDSLRDEYLSSGLSALTFVENTCQKNKYLLNQAYRISTQNKDSLLYYTNLHLFIDSLVNTGRYTEGSDTFHWNKVHDNLIEFISKSERSGEDSSFFLQLWKTGRLYLTSEDMKENTQGYRITSDLGKTDINVPIDKRITNVVVKNHKNHHYLIERKDSLYNIIQFTLTPWGFRKSFVNIVHTSSSNDTSSTNAAKLLDSVQKVSHASVDNNKGMIIFDPQIEELENLFSSPFATNENYLRISESAGSQKDLLYNNWLMALLAMLCLLLLILALNNSRKLRRLQAK